MSHPRIALSWSIGQFHGWGIYGLNLLFAMLRQQIQPLLLHPPARLALNPLEIKALLPTLEHSQATIAALARNPQHRLSDPNTLLLRHTDGQFNFPDVRFQGRAEIGITFFETTAIDPKQIDYARQLPMIITGSRWNQRVLQEHYGLTNVHYIMQGVDLSQFYPSPPKGLLPGRFVIFSGGKLEYRKGQDLVIAAFKKFHTRRPDAFLLTAWNNNWLNPAGRFADTHLTDLPKNNDINQWLGHYLPADSFMDVGELPNPMTPALLRETHVALFPNRCDGGTNLVAMECMAMGLPVILANNTGHQELIDPQRCYPLTEQKPCIEPATGKTLIDWGDSSVDEMVEQLEAVYTNPQAAKSRGQQAYRFIHDYSWEKQCDQLLQRVALS